MGPKRSLQPRLGRCCAVAVCGLLQLCASDSSCKHCILQPKGNGEPIQNSSQKKERNRCRLNLSIQHRDTLLFQHCLLITQSWPG